MVCVLAAVPAMNPPRTLRNRLSMGSWPRKSKSQRGGRDALPFGLYVRTSIRWQQVAREAGIQPGSELTYSFPQIESGRT